MFASTRSYALAFSCLLASSVHAGGVGVAISINTPTVQGTIVSGPGWPRQPGYGGHHSYTNSQIYIPAVRHVQQRHVVRPVVPVYGVPVYYAPAPYWSAAAEPQTSIVPSNSQYGSLTVTYGSRTCIVPWNSVIESYPNQPPRITIPGGQPFYCGG